MLHEWYVMFVILMFSFCLCYAQPLLLIQALAFKKDGAISKQMLKFIEGIPKESWVEVQGLVQIPREKDGNRQPLRGTSQQVQASNQSERKARESFSTFLVHKVEQMPFYKS